MVKTVALLLGVHAHQPVGNFESVLDDAHVRCYGPFLRVLHQYPDFKFAIHLSGWLLDYMIKHYPEDMALLKEMVEREQAELFGAGYTEPVLASIPTRDRVGQIKQLSTYLKQKLGEVPHGAWLTERVWESTVVPALSESGIRYVTVDDYHFMCAGKQNDDLNGYYSTEEDGHKIDLFPISEALRYRLPFSPANEVVSYLESLADDSKQAAAIYFDDIEKFGIWPETYEWVYERGWLRNFIEGVLDSSIIKPMRYSDYHAMAKTRGVVYLPTTSYIEMNEWTLPVPAAHHYADLVAQEKYNNHYEITKPYVRGGIWRNFLMRYPESNWMHKRMLALSARYHGLPDNQKTSEMLQALYEAQANDAYWHGLFGGLYLPHLRRAVYKALLTLEALLDEVTQRPPRALVDLDMDGHDEVFLQNGVLQAIARLDGTASICEFDAYKLRHNFGDTLTRQAEHYHRKVHAQPEHGHSGEGIANPHERVSFKQEITQADLATDSYRKTLFNDFWIAEDNTSQALHYRRPASGKAALDFRAALRGGEIQKKIALDGNSLVVRYKFNKITQGYFKVEINLAMPSCDGPAGRFRLGETIPGGFGQRHQFAELRNIVLEDEVLGGALHLHSNIACAYNSYPHFSVSQSEAGFEKIMQAVTLELEWSVEALKDELEIKLEIL
ncbi:MAG TPA: alpha-amylase/4-alpha-glucanotransferase domain-containing protein [Methylophilaceae bacterium]|nr:alpha-amylase/4-alpha-glucanotransferase domain-containing protein [Methylophilaceae bacterium]